MDSKIWDSDHPTVYCDNYPCTFQFPPWEKATSTIDHPIITVTEGTFKTTTTRSAITVIELELEPFTLDSTGPVNTPTGAGGQIRSSTVTSSGTTGLIFFISPVPSFARTTTWPPASYVSSGVTNTTTPTSATHPPPASGPWPPSTSPPGGEYPTGTLSVAHCKPSPTGNPCDFPAFQCPNPGNKPDGPGYNKPENVEEEDDDGDDDDDDEGSTCPASGDGGGDGDDGDGSNNGGDNGGGNNGGGNNGGGNNGGGDDGGSGNPPKYKHPDPANNKVTCYGKGQSSNNAKMRYAAESFCKADLGYLGTLGENFFFHNKKNPPGDFRIDLSVEIKSGCEWTYNYDECVRYLGVPTNSCDCDGKDGKHGGTVENSCIKWMIDPNAGIQKPTFCFAT